MSMMPQIQPGKKIQSLQKSNIKSFQVFNAKDYLKKDSNQPQKLQEIHTQNLLPSTNPTFIQDQVNDHKNQVSIQENHSQKNAGETVQEQIGDKEQWPQYATTPENQWLNDIHNQIEFRDHSLQNLSFQDLFSAETQKNVSYIQFSNQPINLFGCFLPNCNQTSDHSQVIQNEYETQQNYNQKRLNNFYQGLAQYKRQQDQNQDYDQCQNQNQDQCQYQDQEEQRLKNFYLNLIPSNNPTKNFAKFIGVSLKNFIRYYFMKFNLQAQTKKKPKRKKTKIRQTQIIPDDSSFEHLQEYYYSQYLDDVQQILDQKSHQISLKYLKKNVFYTSSQSLFKIMFVKLNRILCRKFLSLSIINYIFYSKVKRRKQYMAYLKTVKNLLRNPVKFISFTSQRYLLDIQGQSQNI